MPSKKKPATPLHLDHLNHDSIEEAEYKEHLKAEQIRLVRIQRELGEQKRSIIIVFEGPDAAGKGGAIKRLVEKLDPRVVRVYSIVKPTAEEYQHHYMWRFWTKIPSYGQIAVFDRSWYGRILVERVEKFATDAEWQRAFQEINDFERTLHEDGAIIIKFYLHITKDEQLKRFRSREKDPFKHWKINDEDWRNRKKWNQHMHAAHEMFERTSSLHAPWHVIAANFKWHARSEVVRIVADTIEKSIQ